MNGKQFKKEREEEEEEEEGNTDDDDDDDDNDDDDADDDDGDKLFCVSLHMMLLFKKDIEKVGILHFNCSSKIPFSHHRTDLAADSLEADYQEHEKSLETQSHWNKIIV